LSVRDTNLDTDLEHLPLSLEEFYCWGTSLAKELEKYLQEGEKVGNNYLFLLKR